VTAPAKPFPMQLASISFGEEHYFRLLRALAGEGVVGLTDLRVSQKAGGANMSVDVAAGECFVLMNNPLGGLRFGYLAGVANSGTPGAPNVADGWISTFTAADGANPRIDRVVATIYDSALDLTGRYEIAFRVIAGAPTAGATLANLNGVAAVPDNSILLANVLIPAGASTIPDANIDTTLSKVRQHAITGGGLARGGLVPIADVELGAAAASIDFQNIPADFAHLRLVLHGRLDAAVTFADVLLRMNNVSTASYFWAYGQDTDAGHASAGAVAAATSINAGVIAGASASAGYFGEVVIDIPHYANVTTNKGMISNSYVLWNSGTGNQLTRHSGGVWASGTAINRLTLLLGSGSLVVGTRATLYGVAA
jgi:hypothetical protein